MQYAAFEPYWLLNSCCHLDEERMKQELELVREITNEGVEDAILPGSPSFSMRVHQPQRVRSGLVMIWHRRGRDEAPAQAIAILAFRRQAHHEEALRYHDQGARLERRDEAALVAQLRQPFASILEITFFFSLSEQSSIAPTLAPVKISLPLRETSEACH